MMKQLLSAVNYMHKERHLVHRDIKPENIILEDGEMQLPEIKLIDFGTSRVFNKGDYFKDRIGTLGYMSPEILDKESSYNEKCDMWAIGVTAYLLAVYKAPFTADGSGDGKDNLANQ